MPGDPSSATPSTPNTPRPNCLAELEKWERSGHSCSQVDILIFTSIQHHHRHHNCCNLSSITTAECSIISPKVTTITTQLAYNCHQHQHNNKQPIYTTCTTSDSFPPIALSASRLPHYAPAYLNFTHTGAHSPYLLIISLRSTVVVPV